MRFCTAQVGQSFLLLASWPLAAQTYGPQIGSEALANHQIALIDVDVRFRAVATAQLSGVMWYDIHTPCYNPPSAGYACGTGGTIQISIQADDGTPAHLATGTVLGSYAINSTPLATFFPVETFSDPPALVAGTLYHLHFHNIDPDPANNFVSFNAEHNYSPTIPRQPQIDDVGLALYRGSVLQPKATPIFQLTYADGTKQGQGYIENWVVNAPLISGQNQVRERFTVNGGTRVITAVSVRLKRDSTNAGNSPLNLRLELGDGTLLEAGTIAAAALPVGTTVDGVGNAQGWAMYHFSKRWRLANGSTYSLALSAPVDTIFRMQSMRDGSAYGFTGSTHFADGLMQVSADGGSTWAGTPQPWAPFTARTDADMQFYFTACSACDLNGDGAMDALDLQRAINQALSVDLCDDIDGDGQCTVLDVQRVSTAILGGGCVIP